MQIGNMNRNNVSEYVKMIERMNGGKKAHNPLDDVSALDSSKKNTPSEVKAPSPNFHNMPTKSNASTKSDAELAEEIRQLARKGFATGKKQKSEYKKLFRAFVSKSSPDREKLYLSNKQNLGGKMNAAMAYFTPNNQPVLAYNPRSGKWWHFNTAAENKRVDSFNQIYNEENDRLIAKYGRDKIGQISVEEIERDTPVDRETNVSNSIDISI